MLRVLFALAFMMLTTGFCSAHEWSVSRVRGEAQYKVGAGWQDISPGLVLAKRAHLRTGGDGRIDIMRNAETVTLGANSQVEIRDGGAELMTTLIQTSGTLTADVEHRNVQHFSVQTPFLAAVVKGTKFTVTVEAGTSRVDVLRGVVQVQDTRNELVADVEPGQNAVVTTATPLQVEGKGAPPIFTFDGQLVGNAAGATDGQIAPANPASSETGNNGNGGNGNNGNAGNGNNGNNAGNGNNGHGNTGNADNGNNGNAGNGNNGNNGNGNPGNNGNGHGRKGKDDD